MRNAIEVEVDSDDDTIPTLQDLSDPPVDTDDDEIPTLQNLDESIQKQHDDNLASTIIKKDVDLPPVPVTILTGFLGSGKTTLVRHILTSTQHHKHIAVIENEFGGGESDDRLAERLGLTLNDASALSVETMIARDGTDGSNLADFIELPNGCVCCTVKDSLVETLEGLLARRTDLDYVIIEASGMADPGPVASIFWLDEALNSRIRLDGIVTCVDAKNIGFQLESTSSAPAGSSVGDCSALDGGGDEAARQIAFADRIIVNKIDLMQSQTSLTTTTIESVLDQIRSINPTAPIKTASYSKIEDIEWIIGANCFDAERAKDVESAFQQSASLAQNVAMYNEWGLPTHLPNNDICGICIEPPLLPHDAQNRHQHTSAVGTIALFGRGSVDLHKINSWLASILWPDQDEADKVLRARLEEDLSSTHRGGMHAKNDQPSDKKQKIYRVKGILSVGHAVDQVGKVIPDSQEWVNDGLAAGLVNPDGGLDKRRFIVQAVNDLWDVLPASQNLCWDSNETRCCKMVVIGKWLHEGELQEGFQRCFNIAV